MLQYQAARVSSLHKELVGVSAKVEAESKRKMAGIPPLCKAEIAWIRDLDNKPQWVFSALLALSALVWRLEVPLHEYVSRYKHNKKFPDTTLEEIPPHHRHQPSGQGALGTRQHG